MSDKPLSDAEYEDFLSGLADEIGKDEEYMAAFEIAFARYTAWVKQQPWYRGQYDDAGDDAT